MASIITLKNGKKIDLDKHIWEGWRVRDFIDELEPQIENIVRNAEPWLGDEHKPFKGDKKVLKEWIKNNLPYIRKHIPEVYAYFCAKLNFK